MKLLSGLFERKSSETIAGYCMKEQSMEKVRLFSEELSASFKNVAFLNDLIAAPQVEYMPQHHIRLKCVSIPWLEDQMLSIIFSSIDGSPICASLEAYNHE